MVALYKARLFSEFKIMGQYPSALVEQMLHRQTCDPAGGDPSPNHRGAPERQARPGPELPVEAVVMPEAAVPPPARLRTRSLGLSPVDRARAAMFAVAALVLAILVARMIAAHGAPEFLGQDVDPIAASMVLASLVFGVWMTRKPRSIRIPDATDRRLLLVALVVFGLLAAGTLLVFGTLPATPDEQAALFQARLFSEFKIIGQYPTGLVDQMLLPAYHNTMILVGSDGRAISVYWPGWALLMTPLVWFGVPWLLGPAMAGMGVFLIGKLAKLLVGAQAGFVAVLLAVTSGAFILNGMSLYPAVGHLTLSLLYAWLLLRGGTRDCILAGLVGGLALAFNNPFPHAAFALPWVLWLLSDPARRNRLIPLALGYLPGLVALVGWVLLQSTLPTNGSNAATAAWIDRMSLLINIPTIAIVGQRFWELVRVWAWSAPGLLLLAWIGWRRTRGQIGLQLLGASFVATVVLYAVFPSGQGLGYGARYYHVSWGVLPILAAVPLTAIGWERLRDLALAAAIVGLMLVVPLELSYGHGLAAISTEPMSELSVSGVNLCFVDFDKVRAPGLTLNNDPTTAGFIVLISHGSTADQALVDRYFPGARLVIRTEFGSGYARP